jgi:hypothetical protein
MQVEVEVKVEVDVDPVISGTRSSGCGVSGGKRDRPKCVRDQVVLMKSRLIHGQVLVHTREEAYHLCLTETQTITILYQITPPMKGSSLFIPPLDERI